MKVLGVGLSRTGTTSLNHALEILGYCTVHWPHDLSVIDRVDAATDQTVGVAFRELDVKYPGSKFILTVRDIEPWLRSMERMMVKIETAPPQNKTFMYWMRRKIYDVKDFELEKMTEGYRRHEKSVLDYFRDRTADLLVMDICAGDGWRKLCPFLEKEVPEESFPRMNAGSP